MRSTAIRLADEERQDRPAWTDADRDDRVHTLIGEKVGKINEYLNESGNSIINVSDERMLLHMTNHKLLDNEPSLRLVVENMLQTHKGVSLSAPSHLF